MSKLTRLTITGHSPYESYFHSAKKKTILLKIVTKNRSFERFLFYSSRSVVMSSGSGVIGDGVFSEGLFSAVSLV